jgi:hypothetical protein
MHKKTPAWGGRHVAGPFIFSGTAARHPSQVGVISPENNPAVFPWTGKANSIAVKVYNEVLARRQRIS